MTIKPEQSVRRISPLATIALAFAVVGVLSAGPVSGSLDRAEADPERPTTTEEPNEDQAAAAAAALVNRRSADLRPSAKDAYIQHEVISTPDGLQYVPYTRTYRGLPVVGGDFVVVTDADGSLRSTSVQQQRAIDVAVKPKLTKTDAARVAKRRLDQVRAVKSNRLVVHAIGGDRLAYDVVVHGRKGMAPSKLHVYVDALTGKVLRTLDDVSAGTGTGKYNGPNPLSIDTTGSGGQYSMRDPGRPGLQCADYSSGQVFTGSDDTWGNGSGADKETGCVDSLYAAQQEWEMLSDWLGRDGIDGNGNGKTVKVGLQDVNAYWTGSEVQIGYNNARDWISAMDVVGHEFGHAIDAYTPGGIGGHPTQEFIADVFGAATEAYDAQSAPYDTPDYTVGELVNLQGQGPIRHMYEPSKVSGHPNCWSTSLPSSVHAAAGPGNHWFYLLAEGTNPTNGQPTSPTCNNAGTLTGIGIQQATKIVYNAMLRKTSGVTYQKYRTWTLGAAKDLDPTCTQFNKVKAAWDAVSVPAQSGDPTCTGSGDTQAPTAPSNLRSTGSTTTSVTLAWDASTDNVGVTAYDVYSGSTVATTATGTSATVTGLAADTAYTFKVLAKDAAGNVSPASTAVTVRTQADGGGGTAPDIAVEDVKAHLQQFQTIANSNSNRRSTGTNGYYQSASYVAGKLRDAGYTVTEQACTSGCSGQDKNVIAEWKGGDESSVIMFGAHLDSVTAGPGINDNGSGSSILLEVALTLAEKNPAMAKRVRFGWWAAEETGTNGSKFYVNSLSSTERTRIKSYLNFDMNASPNAGYFVDNITTELAKSLTGYFDSIGVPAEEMTECCSDDGNFRNIGVPTTFLSTGASATKSAAQAQKWGGTSGQAFDSCYHQACDIYPDNIHTTALDRNADATAYALWKLAVSATPGDTQPPTAPANLQSTGKTSSTVSLAWSVSTDNVGVTGYDVYQGATKVTTATGASATVTGLAADTEYTFTVRARDAAGNVSPASNQVTVRTDLGDPGGGVVNGGFETGDLSSWTIGGTAKVASVVSTGAYEGTRAARLGSTEATNGESTLSQTFTAPAGSSQLSVYYSMTCPDTVTYAWAKVVLVDNTTGQTGSPLAKTCTNGAGWKQVTAALTAGHSYTLTLVNRDDNHPDDPVHTAYDAVTVN
jgi:Zn-dependent metalloprotease/chitodextrinase